MLSNELDMGNSSYAEAWEVLWKQMDPDEQSSVVAAHNYRQMFMMGACIASKFLTYAARRMEAPANTRRVDELFDELTEFLEIVAEKP